MGGFGYNEGRYGMVLMEGRKIMLTPDKIGRKAMAGNRKNTSSSVRGIFVSLGAVAVVWTLTGLGYCGIETVSYKVSAGPDDGYAWGATEQDVNSGYLMIGDGRDYSTPYYMSVVRFGNVEIPRSASIVDARLKIKSLNEGTRGQVYGVIEAEAVDDAADFSSRYIADANRTGASVGWDHKFNWDANTWEESNDISGIVREVVDRAGWSAGNSLALIYSTRADSGKDRIFGSFEAGGGGVLEVTYEAYVISGYVLDTEEGAVEGVVLAAGADIESSVTDGSGYYKLLVPPDWSGAVTLSKVDWGFAPASRSYINVLSDQVNEDYIAFQPKVSGYITYNGSGVEGVNISADNGGGSDVTDANGYYELVVSYEWSGTVTPSKGGWGFSPGSRSYSGVISDQVGQDYVAFQPVISGYVTDGAGGIDGVFVSADNGGGSDVTDLNGYYEIIVPYGWSGVVTPSKAGWGFSPASRPYSNVTGDQSGEDFVGFPTISGRVKDEDAYGIDGVTVSADNSGGSGVTDANGYYEIMVPYSWSGMVTPSKAGWGFSPASRLYSNVIGEQTNQGYTGFQPVISGFISDAEGSGLEDVAVSADSSGGSDVTDVNGFYEIVVPYGWSGTVAPVKTGWVFTPLGRPYLNVVGGKLDQDYSGYCPYYWGVGSGTAEDQYMIYDANQMNSIGGDSSCWNKYFKLIADIDLSGYEGTEFNVIGDYVMPFTGVFDGGGHTIYGFTYSRLSANYLGLFVAVGVSGEVKNLGLSEYYLAVNSGNALGSMVGLNDGTVSECWAKGGEVSGMFRVGGLVGWVSDQGIVSDCYVEGGNVFGKYNYVGGLVGDNYGQISYCYSAASVSGNPDYGIGGLLGANSGGSVTSCFWDIEGSGLTGSAGGVGKTTAEMQMRSTFTDAGWDFVGEVVNGTDDIWDICEGTNYPKLVWQIPVGDFVCPEGVSLVDFSYFAEAWYSEPGDGKWNWVCDISEPNDNFIDERDLAVFVDGWLMGVIVPPDPCEPIGHWEFDEGSGSTAYDSAGDNDGTIYGAVWATGRVNGALEFDGVDDYVDCGTGPAVTGTGAFAVSAWVKTDSSTGQGIALQKRGSSADGSYGVSVRADGKAQFYVYNEDYGFLVQSSVTVNDGLWHHVAAVRINSTDGEIYVDGSFSGADSGAARSLYRQAVWIGGRPVSTSHFDGVIDDVRIYDRALSAGEIWKIHVGGLGGRGYDPHPVNGATDIDPNVVLSWRSGYLTGSHDVYFGTDEADVNDATTSSAEYMGNIDVNRWDPPGLDVNSAYYWRIDEVNESDANSPWKGDVWVFTTWAEPNLTRGLVSWWKLDESAGSTAYDSAGDNDGTIYGAVWTTGQINGALDFDGTNDYVDCGTGPALTGNGPFSVSAWLKTDIGEGQAVIIQRSTGSPDGSYHVVILPGGNVQFSIYNNGLTLLFQSNVTVNDGLWHHIAVVRTTSTTAKMYVDGSLAGSALGTPKPLNNVRVWIGGRPGSTGYFDGAIDDVRIYDRVLSTEEIWQLCQSGL